MLLMLPAANALRLKFLEHSFTKNTYNAIFRLLLDVWRDVCLCERQRHRNSCKVIRISNDWRNVRDDVKRKNKRFNHKICGMNNPYV